MPQAELQTVTGALAALDDDLDMIQQQLEHQMQAQDRNQDSARLVTLMYTHTSMLRLMLQARHADNM